MWDRDQGRCTMCGRWLREAGRSFEWSVHHRLRRGMGGTSDPRANLPGNLILLCGSGTTGCHGHVERNRTESLASGFLVPTGIIPPAGHPIRHHRHGWVYLTDDGGVSRALQETP